MKSMAPLYNNFIGKEFQVNLRVNLRAKEGFSLKLNEHFIGNSWFYLYKATIINFGFYF
jgi:hypothetical protein